MHGSQSGDASEAQLHNLRNILDCQSSHNIFIAFQLDIGDWYYCMTCLSIQTVRFLVFAIATLVPTISAADPVIDLAVDMWVVYSFAAYYCLFSLRAYGLVVAEMCSGSSCMKATTSTILSPHSCRNSVRVSPGVFLHLRTLSFVFSPASSEMRS